MEVWTDITKYSSSGRQPADRRPGSIDRAEPRALAARRAPRGDA